MSQFHRDSNSNSQRSSVPVAQLPTACPACRATTISTAAKTPDDNSYWRCDRCGEIWNAARVRNTGRGSTSWR